MKFAHMMVAGALGLAMVSVAGASVDLGNYSIFATGNVNLTNLNVGYGVAAGGNLTTSGVSIGSSLGSGTIGVISGGNTDITYGSFNTSIMSGNNLSLQSASVSGVASAVKNASVTYGSVGGGVVYGKNYSGSSYIAHTKGTTELALDFATAAQQVTSYAANLASLTATGTANVAWGNLTLTGSLADTNVFSISSSTLANISSINIVAPTSSTVVINVTGSSVSLTNMGINNNGIKSSNVIFNFYQASSVNISGVSLTAELLAMNATTTINNASVHAPVLTNNLVSSGTSYDGFGYNSGSGTLPAGIISVAPVPETASLAILSTAMFGLLFRSRRKS